MTLLTSYTPGQIEFIKFLHDNRKTITVYNDCTVSRKDLVTLLSNSPYIAVPAWIACDPNRRGIGRGNYLIPEINADLSTLPVNTNKRGRKPGSQNKKGRIGDPATDTTPATTEANA